MSEESHVKITTTIVFEEKVYKEAYHVAIDEGKGLSEVVNEAIKFYLRTKGRWKD